MHEYNFEKLEVWNLSIELTVKIYKISAAFPSEEKFGITNQIRRASNSVSANIAEGTSRLGTKDKARFIQIAYGSLLEVLNFIIISNKLGYILLEDMIEIRKEIEALSNKLNAFHKTIIKTTGG